MPERHQQSKHYKEAIKLGNITSNTKWLIVCDLDEFYYGYPNKLSDTLDEFDSYDVIYSNWRMFGSDGLIHHPEDIRKSIIWRENELHELTKYICKPSKVKDFEIHNVSSSNQIIENDKIRLNL